MHASAAGNHSFTMPTGNAKPTPALGRRYSADISNLVPVRSSGNLIASAGAEAASKARQLRHAATFSLRYQDADTSDGSFGTLLRRHLQTQARGLGNDCDTTAMAQPKVETPSKKLSAKMERALAGRDQCERDLERYFESKRRAPNGTSPLKSPCSADLLDKSYWMNPETVYDNHAGDKSAFDRLLRKLSPAMKNAATTHADLVHLLHACSECSLRATFCARCTKRANEFFDNYSAAELQSLYGRELPPPDIKALAAFADTVAEREHRATQ